MINSIEERLATVRARIQAACARSGRDPEDVRLIAVTKRLPEESVRAGALAGVTDFGENYVQELEAKRPAAPSATWHFLGRVQANKARRVAAAADVVHTLEPGRSPSRLAVAAAERGEALPCLIEVDFTGRRVGVAPGEAETFVESLGSELEVRGLMTVAPQGEDPRPSFLALRELRDRLRVRFPTLVELSMGMTADLDAAVEEGATMVRVGTAIFGPRP